jgi:hypothetical protein
MYVCCMLDVSMMWYYDVMYVCCMLDVSMMRYYMM